MRYFSLDYVDHVGSDGHACLTDVAYYMAHVGEWVFSGAAHDRPEETGLGFLVECFAREYPRFNTAARLGVFLQARRTASAFIENCLDRVDWGSYDIVGFTTSFQQTMASLALARRIKERHPNILIIFGGVNCQDRMGRTLLQQYDFVDVVCVGDGDIGFPELVRRFRAGEPLDGIAGMAVRGRTEMAPLAPDEISNGAVVDMDALPYPDYDDFFAQHARSPAARLHPPAIVFETARGCSWGERHNCTFCGLNGTAIAFRVKSQPRAYEELAYLVGRHDCRDAANADKILDPAYFADFIPRLAHSGLDLTIYYEAKVGLCPDQYTQLAQSGIRKLQLGIETFNTELLRLMAKGTTMLQNIEALKLAAENGIYVEWLALSGFPGERPEQYEQMAELLPKLFHLQPPASFIRARADRFSPYERHPSRYGIQIEPLAAYRHIFPFDDLVIRGIANHFVIRSAALEGHDDYVATAARQYALWQAHASASELWYEDLDDETVAVHDARDPGIASVTQIQGAAADLLRSCWRITRWSDVRSMLEPRHSAHALDEAAEELQARSWLLCEGSRHLTMALRQPGFRRAPSWVEIRALANPLRT